MPLQEEKRDTPADQAANHEVKYPLDLTASQLKPCFPEIHLLSADIVGFALSL